MNESTHELYGGEEPKAYLTTIGWMKKEGCYDDYKREMDWRILKSIKNLVFQNMFTEFRDAYKGPVSHIFSVPGDYFGIRTKLMMAACRLHCGFLCRIVNRAKGRS